MQTVWLENWAPEKSDSYQKGGLDGIKDDFQISDSDLDGVTVLLAYYGYESYEGEAFVLFEKDGKLFEVNGGHCSCYGLEGQWKPEETTVKDLLYRLDEGEEYRQGRYDTQLREVLAHFGNEESNDGV